MLQPIGPLPPVVYWRRRAVAIGGVVLALVALIWSVSALTGGDQPAPRPAAAAADGTTSPATPSTTTTTTSTATTTTTTATETGSATTSPTSTTTTPAGPPKPCADDVLDVTASVAAQEYQVGQKPDFKLVLTNTGDLPCTRDVDRSLMELIVLGDDGKIRLWGSNDCYPNASDERRTLDSGEQAAFPVKWSGLSSQPQCAGQRTTVPAGEYQLVAKFDGLDSEPATFRLIR